MTIHPEFCPFERVNKTLATTPSPRTTRSMVPMNSATKGHLLRRGDGIVYRLSYNCCVAINQIRRPTVHQNRDLALALRCLFALDFAHVLESTDYGSHFE